MSVRFIESCPTCGRRIQFRVSLVGKQVECPHCHSEFATGGESGVTPTAGAQILPLTNAAPTPASDPLMDRVERLLAETQPGS